MSLFTDLMKRFRGMTQHISDRLNDIIHSPEKKEEIQQPIRRSVLKLLERSQIEAGTNGTVRQHEQQRSRKKKEQERDR